MSNGTSHLCPVCKVVKDLSEFAGRKNKRGEPYPSSYCRACQSEYNRQWRLKNKDDQNAKRREQYHNDPEYRRERLLERAARYAADPTAARGYNLQLKFGITLDEYERMFEAQSGLCLICHEPCKSGRSLAVDHDHATGAVRGLLCMLCNNGLGNFRDDPSLMAAAIEYLSR